MAFDPAIHGLAMCTVPLPRYPRLAQDFGSHSATESSHSATERIDRDRLDAEQEAARQRAQTLQELLAEWERLKRGVLQHFPEMTWIGYLNRALENFRDPPLTPAEMRILGGS
jgi:hypothetical protein